MPATLLPNAALADLAAVLGEDNVRTLARTFLRDFPVSLDRLAHGERTDRHRLAHSMKSSSRLMGAMELSTLMADLENRLYHAGLAEVSAEELATIGRLFEEAAGPLRILVGK